MFAREIKIKKVFRCLFIQNNSFRKSEAGFTLLELLIALFGFVIVSMGIVALLSNLVTESSRQQGLLSDQDAARKTSFTFANEIRDATTSNTGAYPLAQAGDQEIIFYSNVDGDALIERVRYFVQSGQLKKGIVKPTGSPLSYNLGSEVVLPVQKNLANNATPVFQYFDGDYAGSGNPLAQSVNVLSVRFIKMNLIIAKTKTSATYTVSSGATLRNLKDNLGGIKQ